MRTQSRRRASVGAWWLVWLLSGAAAAAPCGDVDRSGVVNAADATALRRAFARLQVGVAAPGNCNLEGEPAAFDDDADGLPDECTLVDLVILRRSLTSLLPGRRELCAGDDFALAASASQVSIHRDAGAGVRVTLYRHVSFTADVTVSLAEDVPGVVATPLVFSPDLSDGVVAIDVDPDTPLGGPTALGLVATSGSISRPLPLSLTVLERAPSSETLIENARVAGTIDFGTSLLYRAFALFGDERLPAAYRGSGSEGEDPELFLELERAVVSPALRAQLDTFLLRPMSPGSAFAPPGGIPSPPPSPPGAPLPPPAPPATAPCFGFAGMPVERTHPTLPVKVHAYCRTAQGGRAALAAIDRTIALVTRMWGPMTSLMDEPLADLTPADLADPVFVARQGGGPQIDVYVVDVGGFDRSGEPNVVGANAVAYARSTHPFVGVTSSGFLVLNRNRLLDTAFYSDLVHEFFHVLQNKHNVSIKSLCEIVGGTELCRSFWFSEATATWAEREFAPETAASEVHSRFPQKGCTQSGGFHLANPKQFQCNDESLNFSVNRRAPGALHMYAAYAWPMFMQQEGGGRGAIGAAWQALAGVGGSDYTGAMNAIGGVVSFQSEFRRFAVRNLNTVFPPEYATACQIFGCENPIGTRYVHLDPVSFAPYDNAMPRMELTHDFPEPLPPNGAPRVISEALSSLRASYYHFTVAGGGTPIPGDPDLPGSWEIDVSGLSPRAALGIDAIVRTDEDEWEWREDLEPDSNGKLRLCKVVEIYLVLSNPAIEDQPRQDQQRIQGSLRVRPLQASCSCGHISEVQEWTASVGFSWQTSGSNENATATASHTGSVSFRFNQLFADALSVAWDGVLPTGSVSVNDHSTLLFDPPIDFEDNFTRAPDPNLFGARLSVDLDTCRYSFTTFTEAGGPQGGPRPLPGGDYRTDPLPSLALTGSGSFPAWSRIPDLDDGYAMGGGSALVLVIEPPPGGNPFGVIPDGETDALANWSFVPIRPPP